jgi:ATP-dependent Lon protease
MIEQYTREAGLRNLEREITNICRKIARQVAEGKKGKVKVDPAKVEEMLGPPKHTAEDTRRANVPGVAVGLAWTPAGGDILFIECTATPGDGKLILTGQLGEVMKESAQAAMTYLLAHGSELGISADLFKKKNFHIHVPAGAIPKDGPSAGVAIMLSLASLLLGKTLRPGLAMTGEITLKGNVLPVGGIKEKVLAAHRSELKTLILPKENQRDLIDVPDEIRRTMTLHFVENAREAMKIAFIGAEEKPAKGKVPVGRTSRSRPARAPARASS